LLPITQPVTNYTQEFSSYTMFIEFLQ